MSTPDDPSPSTAVALTVQPQRPSSTVVAAGHGDVADQIRAIAQEAGIPCHHDPALARLLAEVDIGEQVPRELYEAVAEVIAFVWALEESP